MQWPLEVRNLQPEFVRQSDCGRQLGSLDFDGHGPGRVHVAFQRFDTESREQQDRARPRHPQDLGYLDSPDHHSPPPHRPLAGAATASHRLLIVWTTRVVRSLLPLRAPGGVCFVESSLIMAKAASIRRRYGRCVLPDRPAIRRPVRRCPAPNSWSCPQTTRCGPRLATSRPRSARRPRGWGSVLRVHMPRRTRPRPTRVGPTNAR